jgi:ribokinase
VVITGACDFITGDIIQKVEAEIAGSGVFLTQLETNLDAVEKAVDIAHENGVVVILNPAPARPVSDDLLKKVNILTPNETEASVLSGVEVKTVADASVAAKALMKKGVESVIITMGSRGSLVVTKAGEEFIESIPVAAVDTTGAGDAYNGGLATAIAGGKNIRDAARFATATGALSVTKIGTAPAMPYRDEIEKLMREVYGQ